MKRKVINIAAANGILYALCADGTIWVIYGNMWRRVPEVPQDA